VGVLLGLGAGLAAQRSESAQAALRAAMDSETVDGNLARAIEQYRAIADRFKTSDRGVAATALLRMADCYQKQGVAKARAIYEELVRDYPDQKDAVSIASARLGTASPAKRAQGDRVVLAGPQVFGSGRVSPDGRFISDTDWHETGNLVLHDLATGTERPLTGNKDWSVGNANDSTFSRDGRQVAYGWRTYGAQAHVDELRIVNVEGAGTPPRRVAGNDDITQWNAQDWSPDGRWIAVNVLRKDGSRQIGVVGVQDGSFRALKTVEWRGTNEMFFSPDGKYLAYDLPASDTESQRDVYILAVDGSSETSPVKNPAQDVVMGWSPDGARLLFASDRAGTVGLWSQRIAYGKPQATPQLIKPDIGSVSSLGLTAAGALFIVRSASTESLQVAPIDLDTGKLSSAPVLENFRSGVPAWSRDGKHLAYGSTGTNGLLRLSIRSVESGQLRELRTGLAYMNSPTWMPDGRSLVTFARDTKGRAGIYQIDADTGKVSLITEGETNRVQVSPDGTKLYYNRGYYVPSQGPARFVERDLRSGEERELFRRPAGGGGAALSPDGRVLATISVDKAAKSATLLLFPVGGGDSRELHRVTLPDTLEAYGNMTWTPDAQALLVVNRRGTRRELWLVPVNGSRARKLEIDMDNWAPGPGFRLHPNGRQIAFFVGQDSQEVWALENVGPGAGTARR
jgi:Tol biopolymer transport system component